MRHKFFIAVFILAIGIKRASSQNNDTVLSLKQCIDLALNNNLPVKQAGMDMESAEVNLKQAKANLLPDLNGNFNYGFNQGRTVDPITNGYINQHLTSSNAGLNSGIVLFNGLRLQNLIKQNKYSYEASKMDWQQTKDNLTLNVILAYLQVLNNEDLLDITKGQLEVIKKQVQRTEVLAKEGAIGSYQLTDLKGQQNSEEMAIINQENNVKQLRLALCQLMNIEYNSSIQLERDNTGSETLLSKYPSSSAEVFQSALDNFSAVKANNLRIKSTEKSIGVARSGYFPGIFFNANMSTSYSNLAQRFFPTSLVEVPTGDYVIINGNQNPVLTKMQNYTSQKIGYTRQFSNNLGTFAGFSMTIPLFNNFQVRNQVKQAKIRLKSSQLQSAVTNLQLQRDIEDAWLNMDASFDRYRVLLEQNQNYEESFRSAEIRFNNGVINAYEYLVAKNNLDQAKINLSQVKYEYIFRTKLLDFYSGKQLW